MARRLRPPERMKPLRISLLATWAWLGACAVCPAQPVVMPGGYRVEPVAEGATLTGRIRLQGEMPSLAPLPVTADRAGCGPAFKPNESAIVGPAGGVANCVVSLEDILAGKPPTPAVTMAVVDQQSCVFVPHVAQAWTGSPILVKNSDPVYHNVHAYSLPGMYTRFNVGLPQKGNEVKVRAAGAEILVLKCDAGHRWMTSYIHVARNPYNSVTGNDGTFDIGEIPAGRHRVRLWHELAGEHVFELQCPAGATVPLDVTVRLRPKPAWSVGENSQPAAPVTSR